MRGSRDWLRRRRDEPLEPDAGNAAEGSEESEPDWRFQPCVFLRMVFYEPRITRMSTDQTRAVIPSPECFRGEGPGLSTKRILQQ